MRDIDHVMINSEARITAATAFYEAVGFALTKPSHEPGDFKRRIMFPSNYITLFGYRPEFGIPKPDPRGLVEGLTGLALRSHSIEDDHATLAASGASVDTPGFSQREIRFDGSTDIARFGTMRLSRGIPSEGVLFLCQHLEGDMAWRHETLAHANGVTGLADVVLLAASVPESARRLSPMLGDDATPVEGGIGWASANERVLVLDAESASAFFRMPLAARDVPGEALLGMSLRTKSLDFVRSAIEATGAETSDDGASIVVRDPSGALVKFAQSDGQ